MDRLAALVVLATATSAVAQNAADQRPPNVVVILADDLGSGDLGCYNPASKIPTPHMDRIAREGMRFTDAHSPSAVCTPTRYGVLTGRYCWRTRLKSGVLVGTSRNLIATERATLPDLLRSAGYRTAGVGKWHLGLGEAEPVDYTQPLSPSPVDHGFDTYYGIPASLDMQPYVWLLDDRAVQAPTEEVAKSDHRRQEGGGFWRGGAVAPDFRHVEVLPRMAQRAVEFIERSVRDAPEAPFFLYFPLSAPHTPWLPTEAYRGRTQIGYYGDFVCQVDDVVGGVLAALERMGVADETLVVVTSDNGSHWPDADTEKWGHDANNGWRGQKADIWEGGHRVPFLVRWPGATPAGSVRDDLLCLTDLTATLAAIAGVEVPDDAAEDSFDQSAVWRGADLEAPVRTDVIHHSVSGVFAIRSGDWKLVAGRGSGGFTPPRKVEPQEGEPIGQLYDLARDRAEQRNLYLERADVVARLTELLETQKRAGRTRPARD